MEVDSDGECAAGTGAKEPSESGELALRPNGDSGVAMSTPDDPSPSASPQSARERDRADISDEPATLTSVGADDTAHSQQASEVTSGGGAEVDENAERDASLAESKSTSSGPRADADAEGGAAAASSPPRFSTATMRRLNEAEREVDTEVQHIRQEAAQAADRIAAAGRPHYTWHPVRSVLQRQLGECSRRRLDTTYRTAATASLNVVEKIECMFKLRGHDGCVNCLNFNASGTLLASGSDDTFVNIWDWSANRMLHTFDTGHTQNVFHVKFMPLSGDRHVVTCARDCQVRLAELSSTGSCRSTRKLARHADAVHRLAVDNTSPHVLLSAGEDATVFQIDLRQPAANKLLVCRDDRQRKVPLYSISAHPDDARYFALSGRDPFVRIFDLRQVSQGNAVPVVAQCPSKLLNADFKPHVTCVVYNYNGSELLASYNDDDIYSFSARAPEGAEPLHCYQGHRNNATVKGVNYFGPRSEYVVSGSDDGHLYMWNAASEQIVHYMPADEEGVVNVLEPHPSHAALATSGLDHDVKVWLATNEHPTFDESELRQLVFDNRKRRLHERQHPDVDTDFIYYIMHQINRRQRMRERRRRAAAAAGGDNGDGGGEAESNGDSESDSDGDGTDSPANDNGDGDGNGDSDESDGGGDDDDTADSVLRLAAGRGGAHECRQQ